MNNLSFTSTILETIAQRHSASNGGSMLSESALWRCFYGVVLTLAIVTHGWAGTDYKKWTPGVSASLRHFEKSSKGDVLFWSPDRTRFFVISSRGDLVADQNRYLLTVFNWSDVVGIAMGQKEVPPTPFRSIEMKGKNIALNPDQARWDGDEHIVFVGRPDEKKASQVFRYDLASARLVALTEAPFQAEPYGIQCFESVGSSVVANSGGWRERSALRYPVDAVSGGDVVTRLIFSPEEINTERDFCLYFASEKQKTWRLDRVTGDAWLSPDGKHAVVGRFLAQMVSDWKEYDGAKHFQQTGDSVRDSAEWFAEYELVNIDTKAIVPMLNAPTGRATKRGEAIELKALWSEDGKNVVLINTALPVRERVDAVSTPFIVNYNLDRGTWTLLAALGDNNGGRVGDVHWTSVGRKFAVQYKSAGKITREDIYQYELGKWVCETPIPPRVVGRPPNHKAGELDSPRARVREDANTPPTVVVSVNNGRDVTLFDSDPALDGIAISRSEIFGWKDGKGTEQKSVVIVPAHLPEDGTMIPLVIQVMRLTDRVLSSSEFQPDGSGSTAYAGQALVAEGIMVVNLQTPDTVSSDPAEEMRCMKDWVDGVTEALATKFPIDLMRVGLVGFSRTGYDVRYLLTHPGKLRPAAALIADSYTGSFLHSAIEQAIGGKRKEAFAFSYHNLYGGGGFFQRKAAWFDNEVSFNVDKVRTPVLFADNGHNLAACVDTIGAFRAAGRPFEYLLIGDDAHQLTAPRAREASLNATVEWMTFWLQHKAPADANRAARWAVLRKQQDEVLKTPPPPKGKWVFVEDKEQPAWTPPEGPAPSGQSAVAQPPPPVEKMPESGAVPK